jgi:transcriptional regulator with XRE-family HTH domain
MVPTEGAVLLAQALRERGHSQADAERELELAQGGGYVNRLLSSERKPSLHLSVRIEEVYGVPASSWLRSTSTPSAPAA